MDSVFLRLKKIHVCYSTYAKNHKIINLILISNSNYKFILFMFLILPYFGYI